MVKEIGDFLEKDEGGQDATMRPLPLIHTKLQIFCLAYTTPFETLFGHPRNA